ncbi:transmembrane protein, putative [Medicago truncatula]|uniref:Transmembrane protein, putative n=1 Tax=Medicago truncatula TaxID=3880 RepID=G7IMD5_MEDTR|nr:transmembrane protein, putative [Medicago truncatula]
MRRFSKPYFLTSIHDFKENLKQIRLASVVLQSIVFFLLWVLSSDFVFSLFCDSQFSDFVKNQFK